LARKASRKPRKATRKAKSTRNRRPNSQIFLDELKKLVDEETGFASSADLKNQLSWDDEKYTRVRSDLIKSNQINSAFGGPGGKLGLVKDQNQSPLQVFISYSHADKKYLEDLQKHLSILKRLKVIDSWIDQEIKAGDHWDKKISEKMDSANIFLLLVSSDFISSNYCYDVELDVALDRDARKEARVIPVILRNCLWKESRLGHLQALPPEGKPISAWDDVDSAMTAVAKGILDIATEIIKTR
jgi:TIR domain